MVQADEETMQEEKDLETGHRKITKKLLLIVLFYALLFWLISIRGTAKYIIAFSVSAVFFVLNRKKFKRDDLVILLPTAVYLVFGIIANLCRLQFDYNTAKQAILLTLPMLIPFGFYYSVYPSCSDFCSVLLVALAAGNLALLPQFTWAGLLESPYAFIYGIFVLYFFTQKKWKWFFFAVLLLILAHKRIAEAGAIACLVLCWILDRIGQRKYKKAEVFIEVFVLAACLFFIWGIKSGWIFNTIKSFGISRHIYSGRDTIWNAVKGDFDFDPLYIGKGLGEAFNIVEKAEIISTDSLVPVGNIHSDLIAAFVEIGFTGFICWLLSYFYMIRKLEIVPYASDRTKTFLLVSILYTMIMYVTDNILIYIIYWLPYTLILLELRNRRGITSSGN